MKQLEKNKQTFFGTLWTYCVLKSCFIRYICLINKPWISQIHDSSWTDLGILIWTCIRTWENTDLSDVEHVLATGVRQDPAPVSGFKGRAGPRQKTVAIELQLCNILIQDNQHNNIFIFKVYLQYLLKATAAIPWHCELFHSYCHEWLTESLILILLPAQWS